VIFATGRAAFDTRGQASVAADAAASDFTNDLRFMAPPAGRVPVFGDSTPNQHGTHAQDCVVVPAIGDRKRRQVGLAAV
jgi:hypothetical protein